VTRNPSWVSRCSGEHKGKGGHYKPKSLVGERGRLGERPLEGHLIKKTREIGRGNRLVSTTVMYGGLPEIEEDRNTRST